MANNNRLDSLFEPVPKLFIGNVNVVLLLLILAGLGLAGWAFTVYLGPNPVYQENSATITGPMREYKILQEKNGRRMFLWLQDSPYTFQIQSGLFKKMAVQEFLAREQAGSTLTIIADQREVNKPRWAPAYPKYKLVAVFALAGQKEYLPIEEAHAYYEQDKRYALYVAIGGVVCALILFPGVFRKSGQEAFANFAGSQSPGKIEQFFFGYETKMLTPDSYYLFFVRSNELLAARVGGQMMGFHETSNDPSLYADAKLLSKYLEILKTGLPLVEADKRNFVVSSGEIREISFSAKPRFWVGHLPHAGTMSLHFHQGKRRQFILLGDQSIADIAVLLTKNNFLVKN